VADMEESEFAKRRAARREAGLRIDPETAALHWEYAETLDPYRDEAYLPPEMRQIGREYFARAPGTDTWTHFGDLPDATREALWKRMDKEDRASPRWRATIANGPFGGAPPEPSTSRSWWP
jgi:hypothetical protein